ncbi:MAG: hypothetical protein ACPGYP_07190 [Solirubrobacterales bacterium]
MSSPPTAFTRLFPTRLQALCFAIGMALILVFASGQFVKADAASDAVAAKKSKKSSGKSKKCGVRTVAVVTDLALPTDEDENEDEDLLPPDEGDDGDGGDDLIDDDEEFFGLADLVSERTSMRVKSKGVNCSRAVRVVRKYFADPSRRASKRYNGFKCTETDLSVTCKRGRKRVSAVEV